MTSAMRVNSSAVKPYKIVECASQLKLIVLKCCRKCYGHNGEPETCAVLPPSAMCGG